MNAHVTGNRPTRSVEVVSVDRDEGFFIPALDRAPATSPLPPEADHKGEGQAPVFNLSVTVPAPARKPPNLEDLARNIAKALPVGARPQAHADPEPQHRFEEASWQSRASDPIGDVVLEQARRDASYVSRPTAIDMGGDVPVRREAERTVTDLRPKRDDSHDYERAPAHEDRGGREVIPDIRDESDPDLGRDNATQAIDMELVAEASAIRKKKIGLVSRLALGLGILSVGLMAAWIAYAYLKSPAPATQGAAPNPTAGLSMAAPAKVQPPAQPRTAPPAQSPVQAQGPAPMAPAPMVAPSPAPAPASQRPLPEYVEQSAQLAPPPAAEAKPSAPAPAAAPAVAAPPPAPPVQVGPISTRLASITCRSATGAGDAQLLISVGIWQNAKAFNTALEDMAKWTGMQNGMVLFDTISKPDFSKLPAGVSVLAYSGPDQQVASANDVNAKAWIVVSQKDMSSKNADAGACSMRIIAPE